MIYYDPSGLMTKKREERQTIRDSNGYLMRDSLYSGDLPTKSWTITQDGV